MFRNPLVFCHFLEERARAYSAQEMQTDDELDHLGLYLAHNRYTLEAKDLFTGSPVRWHGYRDKIDRYYAERLISDAHVEPPIQKIPQRIREILNFLADAVILGRCRVASWLLDMNGEFRSMLAQMIERTLSEELSTNRAKPLSVLGDRPISVYCWIENKIPDNLALVRSHTLATLQRAGEKERLALELFFEHNSRLVNVRHAFFKPGDIRPEEQPAIDAYEEEMVKRRFEVFLKERGTHKIGRNESCPCGSGRKFKKCCESHR
jgi:preprotein translocase subunit SecA